MDRKEPGARWLITTLTKAAILQIPEVGIGIPVAELHDRVDFSEEEVATR